MLGIVHKINQTKGFCFVEGEDKRDYFVHWQSVLRSSIAFRNIELGMQLKFTPNENPDPKKAPFGTDVTYTGNKVSEPVKTDNSTVTVN